MIAVSRVNRHGHLLEPGLRLVFRRGIGRLRLGIAGGEDGRQRRAQSAASPDVRSSTAVSPLPLDAIRA